MDALDLSTNMRGVGWIWSKSFRFPPDKRPTSRPWFIIYVFLSTLFHSFICGVIQLAVRAFSPDTFTVLSGGTIFDPTLPPLIRYIRSSVLSIFVGFSIYALMQTIYNLGTFFSASLCCSKTLHSGLLYSMNHGMWTRCAIFGAIDGINY
ncbi:hypothetical protein F5J12DRAFT_914934 [Pisolithus orientalis]|uniref:uncharacterized protein n=1 Tax=Pisolithus orientalis TaxID=936130 RepID=UPI00222537B3|nr:uncharacterized protein F5J12DRAFT_914934 [Pisolithus orientalis]KAI5996609.1 hypothetical protein F5J12DRAFT_914934 [Pisolithus orientalis]